MVHLAKYRVLLITRIPVLTISILIKYAPIEYPNDAIALLSRSLLNKLPMKGGEIMGYGGYQGGNYGGDCGYGGNSGGSGSTFVLIVVLFILLIIVGATFAY